MFVHDEKEKRFIAAIDPRAAAADWHDWQWQMKHSIRDIDTFAALTGIRFSTGEKEALEKTLRKFPLSITPYFLSLIDTGNYKNDPIFKQAFPDPRELLLDRSEMVDPLHEDKDSPVPGLTHRYPDRVLFLVSYACAMYCRMCTRKRKVGDADYIPKRSLIQQGIDYIRKTPRVRDVLLSGGDPLMLSDEYLDWLLTELHRIPHVEIVRIGTRMPSVLPYRITDDLMRVLKKHHPLWVNLHFNHPREISAASREALRKLADAGLPLGNQTTLMAGINDCALVVKRLCHMLVQNRVRPYYIFQCDLSEGLSHFRTTVGKGIEIMENLIGHTSSLAVPRFAVDIPGGGGKMPIIPNYLLSWSDNKVAMRNYRGIISSYAEPKEYRPPACSGDCSTCALDPGLEVEKNAASEGIARLLSEADSAFAIIPDKTITYEDEVS